MWLLPAAKFVGNKMLDRLLTRSVQSLFDFALLFLKLFYTRTSLHQHQQLRLFFNRTCDHQGHHGAAECAAIAMNLQPTAVGMKFDLHELDPCAAYLADVRCLEVD